MVSKIKETIQDNLVKRRYRWYQEQIQKQTLTYDEWIREKEAREDETLRAEHRVEHAEVTLYDECRADFDVRRYAHGATPADVLIFHARTQVRTREAFHMCSAGLKPILKR